MDDCGCGGCIECCAVWYTMEGSVEEFADFMQALIGTDTSSVEIRRKERGDGS